MAINNYSDADFLQLQTNHAQLRTDFAVLTSVVATIQKDSDKMEQKFDQMNTKIDTLIEMANQAKGAGQAAKVLWVVCGALVAVASWFISSAMGVKPPHP